MPIGLLSQDTTDFDGRFYQLTAPATSRRACSGRTRRSASAAAARSARRASPPATPSTGTSRAGRRGVRPQARRWRALRRHRPRPQGDPAVGARLVKPDLNYRAVIEDAIALGAEGLIWRSSTCPHRTTPVLEPLAEAIRDSGLWRAAEPTQITVR